MDRAHALFSTENPLDILAAKLKDRLPHLLGDGD
jgi:hypothetical protein